MKVCVYVLCVCVCSLELRLSDKPPQQGGFYPAADRQEAGLIPTDSAHTTHFIFTALVAM